MLDEKAIKVLNIILIAKSFDWRSMTNDILN